MIQKYINSAVKKTIKQINKTLFSLEGRRGGGIIFYTQQDNFFFPVPASKLFLLSQKNETLKKTKKNNINSHNSSKVFFKYLVSGWLSNPQSLRNKQFSAWGRRKKQTSAKRKFSFVCFENGTIFFTMARETDEKRYYFWENVFTSLAFCKILQCI